MEARVWYYRMALAHHDAAVRERFMTLYELRDTENCTRNCNP